MSPIGTNMQRWDVIEQGLQQFLNDPSVVAVRPQVGLGFFGATSNSVDPTECLSSTYAKPVVDIAPIATTGPEILQAMTVERAFLGGLSPWLPALQGSLIHAQNWQTANPNRMTVVVRFSVTHCGS